MKLKIYLCDCFHTAAKNGVDQNQDEELLENWIKELEQGIQGMSDVTGPGTAPQPPVPVSDWVGPCDLEFRDKRACPNKRHP